MLNDSERPHWLKPKNGPLDLRAQMENMRYANGWVGGARGSVGDSLCLQYPLHKARRQLGVSSQGLDGESWHLKSPHKWYLQL